MHWLSVLHRWLSQWPDLNRYTVASLVFGFTGFVLNLDRLRKAVREGALSQSAALDELSNRIFDRLGDPALLTPDGVRSLAYSIEKKYKCAVITDALICEAVRAAAYNLNDRYKHAPLRRRLETLDTLLKGLGDARSRLLSIATVDRLSAFRRSQPIAVGILLGVVVVVSLPQIAIPQVAKYLNQVGLGSAIRLLLLGICATALICEWLLVLGAMRAATFWSTVRAHTQASLQLAPRNLNRLTDFFLLACISRETWTSRFWHLIWAPIWEFSILSGYSIAEIEAMHTFRYDRARDLYANLQRIQRKRDLSAALGTSAQDDDSSNQFDSVCRELWIITGDDCFKKFAETGEVTSCSGLLSLLER